MPAAKADTGERLTQEPHTEEDSQGLDLTVQNSQEQQEEQALKAQ